MKPCLLISILMIAVLSSACGQSPAAPGTASQATLPVPTDTTTPTAMPTETLTPLPSDTPTLAPTLTPSPPMAASGSEPVNCRFGPGAGYAFVASFKVGMTAPILGKNADGSWWQIRNPKGESTRCWVDVSVTTASGDLSGVPVVAAPQPLVTNVSITNPDPINGNGCISPFLPMSLVGTIEVNGPVVVTWHFETQQSGVLSSHTATFTGFGSQVVADKSYIPPIVTGTYWVRLVVTSPNNLVAVGSYLISCT